MPVTIAGGVNETNQPILGRLGRQLHVYFRRRLVDYETERRARLSKLRQRLERAAALKSAELRRNLAKAERDYREIGYAWTYAQLQRARQDYSNRGALGAAAARAELDKYQAQVRAKVSSVFDMGLARGPLNAQVTGTLVRSGYRIEKVLFESLPGWLVSANLYLPDSASPNNRVPGVVGTCGHVISGKASVSYQSFSQSLAKLGFAVCLFDAVGMGERLQIPSGSVVTEHIELGKQAPLVGWTQAGMQAWDASRCVDYLLTRPEIDPQLIGATGNSGGGTQCVWLTAVDDRLAVSGPSCFVTTFRRNFENELFADHEQLPWRGLAEGLDLPDLLLMHAPKPLILIGQERDYFDLRGLREVYEEVSAIYSLLRVPQNLRLHVGPGDHGYHKDGREAMYSMFRLVAFGDGSPVIEPPVTLESEGDIRVTATGNVGDEPGAIMSTALFGNLADALAIERGSPTGAELIERVHTVLRMPLEGRSKPPDYRIWEFYSNWTNSGLRHRGPPLTNTQQAELTTILNARAPSETSNILSDLSTALSANVPTPPNYPRGFGCVFAVGTQDDVTIPLYYCRQAGNWHSPIPSGSAAVLYVAHASSDQELALAGREPLLNTVLAAEPASTLFAVDVRDAGECAPNYNSIHPDNFYGEHAEMLDEPMLGRCVWDVLRVLDLLQANGYSVHLVGKQNGAIVAAHAGLLHPAVTKVSLKNTLTRWTACVKAAPNQMAWPMSRLPSDALVYYDLPDVYAALWASKGLSRSFNATWDQWEYGDVPWGAWLSNPAGQR